ncbi:hypothetical protein ElyMa_004382400 [Elysia marginata]|uniref:Uncharacterized protein n=1 Tax=Elysia marginata TaxID=1093978 RepID=A0AAV4HA23_9GAST|nr:hypothetical protein ElyMa_004382400 [Elysia marginata]
MRPASVKGFEETGEVGKVSTRVVQLSVSRGQLGFHTVCHAMIGRASVILWTRNFLTGDAATTTRPPLSGRSQIRRYGFDPRPSQIKDFKIGISS